MLPQVASEDSIAIGNGRYAHFRRDRRFAQVQVAFTAPEGIDPNPGRELSDQFKELGWTWRPNEPGKPWTYQLERSSEEDPTARGDSRDALHEQFLIIINEYREKHGLAPTTCWQSVGQRDTKPQTAARGLLPNGSVADPAARIGEEQKPKSAEEETRAGEAALAMLDAFASVGAQRCDLTWTDVAGGKVEFRGNRPLEQLRCSIPAILQSAAERQHNVILRPRSASATLVQLDDLAEDAAARLRPVSFLILRTSLPGNYQAWVAVEDGNADFARHLRKATGADLTASGAARISGSFNFKEKHGPAFPRVETVHVSPGLIVTRAQLAALGIAPPSERSPAPPGPPPRRHPRGRAWPSYQRCLDRAPPVRGGDRPDTSRADFTFALLALDWGWSIDEVAARLLQESAKSRQANEAYALRTAQAAAAALDRRRTTER